MRIDTEILIRRYKDDLFALAYNICKDSGQAEDIIQDVFVKYHFCDKEFESEQHIRFWLARVTANMSKNYRLCYWRTRRESVEEYAKSLTFEENDARQLFLLVMSLPQRYRTVLHLYYYEGFSVKDISRILSISESNVKTRLCRGRAALKPLINEDENNER